VYGRPEGTKLRRTRVSRGGVKFCEEEWSFARRSGVFVRSNGGKLVLGGAVSGFRRHDGWF
jgi:hypothetical protein